MRKSQINDFFQGAGVIPVTREEAAVARVVLKSNVVQMHHVPDWPRRALLKSFPAAKGDGRIVLGGGGGHYQRGQKPWQIVVARSLQGNDGERPS